MDVDLVFEGGGAKGLAFVGALQAIERHGHKARRVVGTSAGSIVAILVAAGYSAAECKAAINERLPDGSSRFGSFLQTPTIDESVELSNSLRFWLRTELDNPLIPNIIEPVVDKMIEGLVQRDLTKHVISLLAWGGWYAGDTLVAYLTEKLDAGGRGLGSSTLREFHEKTGRDFSAVASDITDKTMLVLNHRTAPDCPTVWAVRMSMSCPLVWQEVVWKKEWGPYLGHDIIGHKVVDGGLSSNFPIALLVSDDDLVEETMGEESASDQVIGLLLDDGLQVPGAEDTRPAEQKAPGFLERTDVLAETMFRLGAMGETLLGGHDKYVIDEHKRLVCRLPAKGYGILEFDLTPERMAPIVNAGEAAMEAHLAQANLGGQSQPVPAAAPD
ncbi:MAG: patatin-like phospholipase family protein [Anaerolineales bacterium]|nr:patatin-like phospholipase family protein [Anaerolineales bacterium]